MPAVRTFLLVGDDYLANAKVGEIVRELLPEAERAMGLEVVDGAVEQPEQAVRAVAVCRESLLTGGLFAARKAVWLRGANFLHDNKIGNTTAVHEALSAFAELVRSGWSESHALLITASEMDRRTALFKALERSGPVYEFKVGEGRPQDVEAQTRERVVAALRAGGLRAGAGVVEAIAERVGSDPRQILNEVEKLDVYMGEVRDVSPADVEAIVCRSREIQSWDLADAFGNRDLGASVSILRQLVFQRVDWMPLLGQLEGRIRMMVFYREAAESGWLSIADRSGRAWKVRWADLPPEMDGVLAGMLGRDPRREHWYRTGLLVRQSHQFSSAELARCLRRVVDMRLALVSSGPPPLTLMEVFLARCLRRPRRSLSSAARV